MEIFITRVAKLMIWRLWMIEEKSKKEIFKDYNLRRKMDKLFRFVNAPKSFSELKEKSLEFQKNLEEEQKKQKLKSKPTSDQCVYK